MTQEKLVTGYWAAAISEDSPAVSAHEETDFPHDPQVYTGSVIACKRLFSPVYLSNILKYSTCSSEP